MSQKYLFCLVFLFFQAVFVKAGYMGSGGHIDYNNVYGQNPAGAAAFNNFPVNQQFQGPDTWNNPSLGANQFQGAGAAPVNNPGLGVNQFAQNPTVTGNIGGPPGSNWATSV